MNEIKVLINFKEEKNIIYGTKPITGDYNSTKLVFTFEDNPIGTKVLKIRHKESDNPVYVGEINNNEVVLTSVDENDKNHSIFTDSGIYILEVSLYNEDSKLTSVYSEFLVNKEQIEISDVEAEKYLPIFDELLQNVDTAILKTNTLDLNVSKLNKMTNITLTKKDGTEKQVQVLDGNDGANGERGEQGLPGNDGYSPTVETIQDSTGANIVITDANGTHTARVNNGANGNDGQDGADGFSPIANVSQSGDITTISITDKNGTTTQSIDLSGKQDTLTAGTNITIDENNVISASGGSQVYDITENATNATAKATLNEWYNAWGHNSLDYPDIFVSKTDATLGKYTTYRISSLNKYFIADNYTGSLLIKFIDVGNPSSNSTGTIKGVWLSLTLSNGVITSISWTNGGSYTPVATNINTTITATHTYNTLPISTVTPTTDYQFANKKYVDDSIASAITDALGGNY